MTYIPDLSTGTYNKHHDDACTCLSFGWLGEEVPCAGDTAPSVLQALLVAKEKNQLYDGWMGVHSCEICGDHHDKGEFFVGNGSTRYILPNMVDHYIQIHRYRLPEVVEAAFLKQSWPEKMV